MEEDAALAWDPELNAAFWDEDAAPSMPSASSCHVNRDSNTTPAVSNSSTHASPAVSKVSGLPAAPAVPKTAFASSTPAAPAASTTSDTPAARVAGSSRSAPRLRRFLYPAASQIARDTPDRRRRPKPVRAPQTPQTPAEQRRPAATDTALTPAEQRRHAATDTALTPAEQRWPAATDTALTPAEQRRPAATDTALTPAEQRDVQACLATALEALEDDGDTFFTQCRVSTPPGRSEAAAVSPGGRTADGTEREASVSARCAADSEHRDFEPMEIGSVTEAVVLPERSRMAGSAGPVNALSTDRDRAMRPLSQAPLSCPLPVTVQPTARHSVSPAVRLIGSAIRSLTVDTLRDCAKVLASPAAPGSVASVGRPRPALGSEWSSSEHRTPAGRPADRSGRFPPAKRLWSAADEAESGDDEPGCSPVLSSHKKRRRHDRRQDPTASLSLQLPMQTTRLENVRTDIAEADDAGKATNPVSLGPADLVQSTKGSECSKFAGLSTAAGRKLTVSEQQLTVSEQPIQKAVTLLRDADASSNDSDLLNLTAACYTLRSGDDEKRRDGSGAGPTGRLPDCSVPDSVDTSTHPAVQEMDERRRDPPVSTIGPGEAADHRSRLNVGFQTASGKKMAISDEAVRLARAKFIELDEAIDSDELVQLGKEGHRLGHGVKLSGDGKRYPVADSAPVSASPSHVNGRQCDHVNIVVASSTTTSTATDQNMNHCVKVCPKQVEPPPKHSAATVAFQSSVAMNVSRPSTSLPKPVCGTVEAGADLCRVSRAQRPSPAASTLRLAETDGGIGGTLVSGFQTAGGRKVAVSAKALTKAKTLFNDIDDVETNNEFPRLVGVSTKTDSNVSVSSTLGLKNMCPGTVVAETRPSANPWPVTHRPRTSPSPDPPSTIHRQRTGNESSTSSVSWRRSQWDDGAVSEQQQQPPAGTSLGFSTAAGRPVVVSEEALKASRRMMESVAVDDLKAGSPQTETVVESEQPGDAVTAAPSCAPEITPDTGPSMRLGIPGAREQPQMKRPCGFATASGRPVNVSEAALKKAKALFDSDAVGGTIKSENLVQSEVEPSCDLTTDGEGPVNIPEAGVGKTKGVLINDTTEGTMESGHCVQPEIQPPRGFATASGKFINVSKAALKKAKATLDETIETDASIEPPMERLCGFATAAGKPVKISEAALKKAKAMLDDEIVGRAMEAEKSAEPEMDRPCGFATASGRPVKVSEAALKKAKALLDSDIAETMAADSSVKPTMERPCGFTTAGGQPDEVSEAVLKETKGMLDNNIVDGAMEVEDSEQLERERPCGFATAGGKPVKIAEAALKKAKAMLNSDIAENMEMENYKEPEMKRSCGFATASGKSVEVSETALKKAKAMLDSDVVAETMETEKSAEPEIERPCGFATAAGRPVKVSEAALKKAKTMLESDNLKAMDVENSKESVMERPCGFATASGRSVKVSETALKKAKTMLDSDSVDRAVEADNSLQGFSTAGGRPVAVSEIALEKAKAMLNSENVDESLDADGFIRPGSRRPLHALPRTELQDASHMAATSLCNTANVTPDVPIAMNPKVRFLSCDKVLRRQVVPQHSSADGSPPGSTRVASPSPVVSDTDNCPPPTEGLSACSGTPHQSTNHGVISRPAPDAATAERGQGDPELASAGLTQVLDERFEFTQVVAERRRHAEEERSASPVLGTAGRHRAGRRRSAEPAVFRTPYRSGPPRRAAARRPAAPSATHPAAPPAAPPAAHLTGPAVTASAAAPPATTSEVTTSRGVEQQSRAEARRRQAELVAAGASRRVTTSVGSLMQRRLKTVTTGAARRSLRDALGPRPANLTRDELLSLDVPADVMGVTFASAASYRFRCTQATIEVDGCEVVPKDDDTVGVEEVRSALLSSPSVQPSLVPESWVENAFRHIVWKLAAYERQFPDEMAGRCLTVEQLVRQLRYRYDRELDRCERPALRRITEGDDTAAKTLILCVAEVNTAAEGVRLVVSDGWYSIPAQGDSALRRLARLGRVRPGLKLAVHGAELSGQQNRCSPLEASAELCLRFSTNSCRRARWDARLGYHSNPAPFASCLSAVLPDGGSVARLDAAIARVYPLLYYGKEDSGGVFRTARCEHRRAAAAEAASEARLERLYAAVERQLGSQERPAVGAGAGAVRRPVSRAVVRQLSTGQQIYECVAAAADPGSVESLLTEQQQQLAAEYQRRQQERHRERVEAEFRARLRQEQKVERPATPLLKVRLAGRDNVPASGAILTLWRPSDELQTFLVEGNSLSLYGVTSNGKRSGILQLSAGTQLRLQPGPARLSAPARLLAPLNRLATVRLPYAELDVVALVVRLTDGVAPAGSQTVHLADRRDRLLAVVCWTGLKALGLDELVVPGALLAFANLQLCSAAGRLPLCALTDRAEVSRRPTAPHLADELQLLTAAATGRHG